MKVCPEVNFVFDTDGLYAQGMNSSHVIIFELKLKMIGLMNMNVLERYNGCKL